MPEPPAPSADNWPSYLHGVSSPVPALRWHRMLSSSPISVPETWHEAKWEYHGAWQQWLATGLDMELAPLVSVVIPAYNAGEMLMAAIDSCRAQTYGAIEVVVVDDGSDSPIANLGNDIHLIRQANAGPAAARNTGVAAAHGHLVQFLDADDWMDPSCLEIKMDAMRLIPDADLCFSDYAVIGANDVADAAGHTHPAIGDEYCPTLGLLRSAARRFVFQTSTLLVARWMLLRAGPFNQPLRGAEDGRYWFRLGLLDAKVVAVDLPLSTRRLRYEALSGVRSNRVQWWALVALLNLTDLLAAADRWRLLGSQLQRMNNRDLWREAASSSTTEMSDARAGLVAAIGHIDQVAERAGVSPRPTIALLTAHLRRTTRFAPAGHPWTAALAKAVSAVDPSLPVTNADRVLWMTPPPRPSEYVFNSPAIAILDEPPPNC